MSNDTSTLHIEIPREKKGAWVYAARFRGQSLRDWVIETLDAAVPTITREDDEVLLQEWLNCEWIEVSEQGEAWYSHKRGGPRQQLTESQRIEYFIFRESDVDD